MGMASFKKYLRFLALLTFVLLAANAVVFEILLPGRFPLPAYFFFVYFFALTAFLHHRVLKANEKRPERFVPTYTGLLGLKMLVSLVVAGVFAFIFREDPAATVITFLILYFTYTFFEVMAVVKLLKKSSAQQ